MFDLFLLQTVLDTFPNAVFMKNESLQFVYVNSAYEKMFGVKKEEVIGKTVLDLNYLPSRDKRFYHNEDTIVIQNCKTKHHIFEYVFKDGKVHTCLYWSGGFSQPDGVRGLLGVIVDITQQSKMIETLKRELQDTVVEKKRIEEESSYDALTRVYNRRTFDVLLKNHAASSTKSGRAFSCVMLDIDHFKLVNDEFGHPAGDSVLQQLGSVLKDSLRDEDAVCRYGGEEFVLLLPNRGLADAVMIAERVRQHVRQVVRVPDSRNVTISAGCSEYLSGEDEARFIKRADEALYQAKENGRDRVCAAQSKGTGTG